MSNVHEKKTLQWLMECAKRRLKCFSHPFVTSSVIKIIMPRPYHFVCNHLMAATLVATKSTGCWPDATLRYVRSTKKDLVKTCVSVQMPFPWRKPLGEFYEIILMPDALSHGRNQIHM